MNALIPTHNLQSYEVNYFDYFDFDRAYNEVLNHIKQLPSMLNAPSERHTLRAYIRYLRDFMAFHRERYALPSEELMREYIAHLRETRQLKSNSINTHLAPCRVFCRFLATQNIDIPIVNSPNTHDILMKMQLEMGIERQRVHINRAANVKNPRPTETTHHPEPKARWISESDFQTILNSCPSHTLEGQRNRAILLLTYWTGLRRAAVARITLANFARASSKTYAVNVMDKRRNSDAIACPKFVYDAIQEYIENYNNTARHMDIPPITHNQPFWRPFTPSGHPRPTTNPNTANQIYRIISALSAAVNCKIAPHDLRRSVITNSIENGMPVNFTSEQVRHNSLDTTAIYKKRSTDFDRLNFATYSAAAD